MLDVLNAVDWGDLFVAGVMSLESSDALALLAHGADVWLLAAGAVFSLDPEGRIQVVGAHDQMADFRDPSRTVVHLFDGRSLVPPKPPEQPKTFTYPLNQGAITIALKSQPPATN